MASSSSGSADAIVPFASAVVSSGDSENNLVVLPWKGMVLLDSHNGKQCLTNIVTHEKFVLAESDWQILYDDHDEGLGGMICREEISGNLLLRDFDELFKKRVFLRPSSGEQLLVEIKDGKQVASSLDAACVEHKEGSAAVKVGTNSAFSLVALFVFIRCRSCQQRVYWSLHDVYKFLDLKCYDKQPSKWVGTLWQRWATQLTKAFSCEHLILGSYLSNHSVHKQLVPWPWRSGTNIWCLCR